MSVIHMTLWRWYHEFRGTMNILYETANHNFLESIVSCGVWTCFLMIKVKLSILVPIIVFLSGIQKRWNQVRLTWMYITFWTRLETLCQKTRSITKILFNYVWEFSFHWEFIQPSREKEMKLIPIIQTWFQAC